MLSMLSLTYKVIKTMIIRIFLISVLTVSLFFTLPALSTPSIGKGHQKIVSECIKSSPRFHTKKNVIFAVYDGPIYQVMSHILDNANEESWREFLVKIKGSKCEILYSDDMGDAPPISQKFPNAFGRAATRNSFRYFIKEQGKERLQQWVDNKHSSLDQIQKDELKRLGLNVK
jgi:hypothetical protein